MSLIGWRQRSIPLESGGFVCPQCQTMRSFSQRKRQRAFYVFGLPLTYWLEVDEPPFAECEGCGTEVKGDVLHDSSAIAAIEGQSRLEQVDDDEEAPDLEACPDCGRMNAVTTRVCPRCETHLSRELN